MQKYYHGAGRSGPYFEGWYLKYQARDGGALALIPALHVDGAGRRTASLQVIARHKSWWLDYPAEEAHAAGREFQIRMGKSTFQRGGACLRIDADGLSLHGTLRHGPFAPLRSDIMGPFRFLPWMECSHAVLSMGHPVEGTLSLNGETMDLSGGIGYVESDRGRSFPSAYLWTQCAWQGPERGGLMLSIAAIPLGPVRFTGCICAVHHGGREYRLATYHGARVERWSKRGAAIRQGKYRLEVEALREQGRPLRAPVDGAMGRVIHESLCATVRYRFQAGRELLFDRTDARASFEYADETAGG